MDLLMQYLIICPLVMLAGFIDAIAGGGGLISLPAYMIAGIPVHHAIATNKMSSTMGTALATFKFARKGFIPWKIALSCVVCAFAGSTLGANLALLVNAHIFMLFMIIVLPLTAVYVQKTKSLIVEKEPLSFKKTTILSMAMALLIGVYDGFYGPGTGTFLLLLLTGVAHLSIHKANGVTKAINLTTNVAWHHCRALRHGRQLAGRFLLCERQRKKREADHHDRPWHLLPEGHLRIIL